MKQNNLFLYLGIGSSLLTACANKQKTEANITKPNVIFIVADDIGFGDLSCNGSTTIHTPNVERVANKGIRFTDAHSVAATSTPSRYALFTGEYAWRRNDTGIATGDAGMVIRPEQTTIADLFQAKGYMTGAVGKWHLGLSDRAGGQDWNGFITPGPSDIGFQYSYIMAATGDRVPCVWVENQRVVNLDPNDPIEVSYKEPFPGEPLGKDHPEILYKLKPSLNHGHDMAIVNGISRIGYMKGGKAALWEDENIADSITYNAVEFIKNNKNNPFFLYVGTNDIHVPRYPHKRFEGKSGMGKRGDAILSFDWTVGCVLDALEEAGIADNTLIVLTSDNGPVVDDGYADQAVELLGEHKPWAEFRGGKYSSFEAGTRVPFLVSWPAMVKPGVSDALVSQIDLFASMAALLDSEESITDIKDSQNYLNTLLGYEKEGRPYIIESAYSLSVSDGEWKYIEPSNAPTFNKLTNTELGNSPEVQLYHLATDIGEKQNVAAQHPEKVEYFKKLLQVEKSKTIQ